MKNAVRCIWVLVLLFTFAGCGEEYYSTPEKTLQRYVDNRMMGNREEYESCLNAFTDENRKWFEDNYLAICRAAYGRDYPGEGISTETTVWTDMFEPAGPNSIKVESSDVDESAGTAVLVVDGQEIDFVKVHGNWKINGFFGVPEDLGERYPGLRNLQASM